MANDYTITKDDITICKAHLEDWYPVHLGNPKPMGNYVVFRDDGDIGVNGRDAFLDFSCSCCKLISATGTARLMLSIEIEIEIEGGTSLPTNLASKVTRWIDLDKKNQSPSGTMEG